MSLMSDGPFMSGRFGADCDCEGPAPPIELMKLENPGLVDPMELTAAWVNFCMRSGFWRMMSSMPGIADLNMVLVMCSMIALPPSWKRSLSSGAILALDLYLSWSSAKMSSYSSRFSPTCSAHPSSLTSKGSNLELRNSIPVMHAISILPWNLTLFDFSFSDMMFSYSPRISSSGDSIEYFLVRFTPLASSSSSFLKNLNLVFKSSSLDISGAGGALSGSTLLSDLKPSQVLLVPSP